MAAWITPQDVEKIVQLDLTEDEWITDLITHCQALAEVEIGEQETPTSRLKAIFAEIVASKWRAGQAAKINPAGEEAEGTGPFSVNHANARAAGLGLTDREIKQLKKAVGQSGLWVQPTTRGGGLETPPIHDDRRPSADELVDVVGGDPLVYIDPEDV